MIFPTIHAATRQANGRYKRPDKPDACIIRFAEGRLHMRMLNISALWHLDYCRRWNFDLIHIEEHFQLCSAVGWLRWKYIREAIDHYEYVCILETDTLIASKEIDLRIATMEYPLAMRYGGYKPEPNHFQSGVIFARRSNRLIDFLDQLISLCPDESVPEEPHIKWWERQACQQWAATLLLESTYQDLVRKLDWQWNTVDRDLVEGWPEAFSIIRAWHGSGTEKEKLDLMVKFLLRNDLPFRRKLSALLIATKMTREELVADALTAYFFTLKPEAYNHAMDLLVGKIPPQKITKEERKFADETLPLLDEPYA